MSASRISRARPAALPLVAIAVAFAAIEFGSGSRGAIAAEPALDTDGDARVRTFLQQLEKLSGDAYWTRVARLAELGDTALPEVRRSLDRGADRVRLACAKVLLDGEDDTDADQALLTVRSLVESRDREVRVSSAQLLGLYGDPEEDRELLEKQFGAATAPRAVIAFARALWNLDHVTSARDKLVRYLAARDLGVRREAALALAEMDYFDGAVKDILRGLRDEPSAQGRRAASLDHIVELSRQLDRKIDSGEVLLEGVNPQKLLAVKEKRILELERELEAARAGVAAGGEGAPSSDPYSSLFEEIVEKIQSSYVQPKRTSRKDLFLGAIEGMVERLDAFSSFLGVSDTKEFDESMAGEYYGIGAHIYKASDAPLHIPKVLYGGPAHRAGVRAGDRVTHIDGEELTSLDMEGVVGKLKGPKNSKVTLTIRRPGVEGTSDYAVVRGRVKVPSLYSDMLPGNVGYVRLTQFGYNAASEFTQAVDALEKKEMRALIVDLRDNPGGELRQATAIVDQFVAGELPIVTQKGSGEDEFHTMPDDFARPEYPMIVLVNEHSASASEIVAGALQDYGRARILGRQTYGKGSVQRLIKLSRRSQNLLGGEARLRLTVQYYFLPLGRCVHTIVDENGEVLEGGVKPDVEIAAEKKISLQRAEEMERVQRSEKVAEYIAKHAASLRELYKKGDDGSLERYPESDALYTSLGTKAPKDDVRRALRELSRRLVEDANNRDEAQDFREDRQLRTALVDILKRLGDNREDHAELSRLPWDDELPPTDES